MTIFSFLFITRLITLLHADIPSVIIQFQLAFPLFVVIIGKQGKKTADGFYRLGSALADFLFLQTQQQYADLLASTKYPFYNAAYFKALPFIVELRQKSGQAEESELETCFEALYGILHCVCRKRKSARALPRR